MLTKNQIKYYSSLLKKKYRDAEEKFLVEGKKLVDEAVRSRAGIELIAVTYEFEENEAGLLDSYMKRDIRIEVLNKVDFDKLTDTVNPQGIAAVVWKPTQAHAAEDDIIAALEDISDPGNMGTILRSGDWFNIRSVLLSETCADIYNPKTLRAAMGSVFHLNIKTAGSFYDELAGLRSGGYKIITADIKGKNIYEYNFPDKFIVVLSNEANGPTDQLLNITDDIVTIPRFGRAESLNVANSAAVIFSEIRRKFQPK